MATIELQRHCCWAGRRCECGYLNPLKDKKRRSIMIKFVQKATYKQWLALMIVPLFLTMTVACNQQTIVTYVTLAVDTAAALTPLIPALAPISPYLQIATAGLSGWKAGQPIPQNVVAALQAALAQAEKSIPGITPAQQAEIGILVTAILGALTIAGVIPASDRKSTRLNSSHLGI